MPDMEAVIAFCLVSLATLLFYKFVEREHKIILGKITLGLASLAALALGGLYIYERRQGADGTRAGWFSVAITSVPDSATLSRNETVSAEGEYHGVRITYVPVTATLSSPSRQIVPP